MTILTFRIDWCLRDGRDKIKTNCEKFTSENCKLFSSILRLRRTAFELKKFVKVREIPGHLSFSLPTLSAYRV